MAKVKIENQHREAEIKRLEDRHGTVYFRMGLTHLFDCGFRNMTEENASQSKTAIMEAAAASTDTGISIMTPEFQCYLIDIALELTQFSIWDLLAYVKTHIGIG